MICLSNEYLAVSNAGCSARSGTQTGGRVSVVSALSCISIEMEIRLKTPNFALFLYF